MIVLRPLALVVLAVIAAAVSTLPAGAAEPFITVASTTSTQNSGLFDFILPRFTQASGIAVRVVAVGTGQAIRLARNGDADVLLVHHRKSEEKVVADGFGVKRHPLMYNDFVVVGPMSDPAGIGGGKDIGRVMAAIAAAKAPFVSRGDDSGTHKKELELWRRAGTDPVAASGTWYREAGAGMGATLNTAAAMDAYALTDRGTWLKFKNRGGLGLLAEGMKELFNPYGVVLVNPAKHPHVKAKLGQAFIDWLLSATGQAAIDAYRIEGRQAFFGGAE